MFQNFETVLGSVNPDILNLNGIQTASIDTLFDGDKSDGPISIQLAAYEGSTLPPISTDTDIISFEGIDVPQQNGASGPGVMVTLDDIATTDLFNEDGTPTTDGLVTLGSNTAVVYNFESVIGTNGNDTFFGTGLVPVAGVGERNLLFGLQGNDILVGRSGEDLLVGDDGKDILFGGFYMEDPESGSDELGGTEFGIDWSIVPEGEYPRGYTDFLFGGDEFDTYYVSDANAVWDMTLEQTTKESFASDGEGEIYFNGKLLGDFEEVDPLDTQSSLGLDMQISLRKLPCSGTTSRI